MHFLSIVASGDDSGGSALPSLVLLALIPLALYFFMIRPQRRRMREQQSLQRSLGVGDEVVTTSGIFGFITGEDGDKFWLEIDDDVQIRIARAAIQNKVDTSTPEKPVGDDDATKTENQ